jgi:hypothetical protein
MSRRVSDFLKWFNHFLIKIVVLLRQRAFKQLAALHVLAAGMCKNCIQLAASRMKNIPAWLSVAFNMIKSMVICLRLAAKRVQCAMCIRLAASRVEFECDWPPVECYFCMQLAATLTKFVCASFLQTCCQNNYLN